MMGVEVFIARRYLRSRQREKFISLITVIATLGVILGVMTLNVVLAIMTGFEEDLRDRILGLNPQVVVTGPDDRLADAATVTERVMRLPGVEAAAPFATGQVMVSAQGNVTGCQVRGIGPGALGVLALDRQLREGRFGDLFLTHDVPPEEGRRTDAQLPGIIIGREMSHQLGLLVGDVASIVSPLAQPSAVGLVPRVRRFVVVGIFESGMSEYDAGLAYMNLPDAQRFFDLGAHVSGIELRGRDLYAAREVRDRARAALGPGYDVKDWMDQNRSLFSALRMEKYVYAIVLLLIVLIAAFNIIAMLVMMVMEKRKDIAILKSMGAAGRTVARVFHYQGMIIGLIGTSVGNVLAFALCSLLERYPVVPLPPGVFYVDSLPVRVHAGAFLAVTAASLLICLLATLYPARHAARLTPVEVIRYE